MMMIWWRRVGEGEGLKGEIAWVELSLTPVTGKQRLDEEEEDDSDGDDDDCDGDD